MTTITREQAQKIIDAADEVITALAGTNEDVHPESDNMLRLWDDLNDRYAPPEVVRELARIALASLDAGSDSNSHPAPVPLSNDRLHRISDILRKAAAQSDGGNIGYAMSDAVKAIDELLEVRKAEPVADVVAWASPNEERKCDIRWRRHDVAPGPLYTAPPAPVVPEAKCDDDGNTTSEFDYGWNACRAAMLNGGKSRLRAQTTTNTQTAFIWRFFFIKQNIMQLLYFYF
ncbi:hypothetical protein [Citrobacter sp. CK205]|uniref:hypothetical protein n=1 Tax=Citrobacter sp. CK205 TaxID=2985114 RepID=UPI0025763596|nr:hypothetical protein [Citrobacter sp. CK205]MDM3130108.1 hypothetical protein [Citrobacter sp. CK205]